MLFRGTVNHCIINSQKPKTVIAQPQAITCAKNLSTEAMNVQANCFHFCWNPLTFLYLVYGAEHASLQLQEPFLHLPTSFRCRDDIQQLHHLSFAAPHMSDVQNVSEHDISNTLKTLFQVGLHPGT